MASSTYSGVVREVPIVPFAVGRGSQLGRGNVVEWDGSLQQVRPWRSGVIQPLGICTGSADVRLQIIDVYCAKGCSVLIKFDLGVVPDPNHFLFWSAPGLVSNSGVAGQQFARAIGVGINGFVSAIICWS
jgi:hypothetical protein